jgi:RNA polymerase sigma-70 factor, ECF subfamily
VIAATCLSPRVRDRDTELMLRLQRGDRDALRPLLERNHQRVVNLAFRFGADRDMAEEVAQETFFRVYKARDRYRSERPFAAYLLRVATNLCLSRARKLKSRRTLVDHDAAGSGAGTGKQPDEDLLQAELRARVRAAVATLPDRQRAAVVLQRFDGLSYEEVGDALGLTVSATKSLLHRARLSLRDRLAEYSLSS